MRSDLTGNLDAVLATTAKLHPQFRFAAAKALSDSVKAARDGMPGELDSALDRPTTFTRQGFFTQGARKDTLVATVGVKDRQAQYLIFQVDGGTRDPSRKALRLPADVQLDASGNLPAGTIRRLVERARAGKRATKGQARRFGVSSQVSLFYGDPGDGRPAGIYKRVPVGGGASRLVPVVVFPQRSARYSKRFDFYGVASRIVQREFPIALQRAWALAISTAR